MLAFVNAEGNCAPVTADEVAKTFSKVPLLAVWGEQQPVRAGAERRRAPQRLREHGRRHQGRRRRRRFLLLPEAGHKGNSHMLMMEKNNLAIADLIIGG